MRGGRQTEAAQRFAERRRREDEAPRLRALVPTLESLELQLEELRSGASSPEARHTRKIVVAHAPALFVFPCREPACEDGGHDLTDEVLSALRAGAQTFEGEDECRGLLRSGSCQRVLRFIGIASYRS
jgi:hypothetical protein